MKLALRLGMTLETLEQSMTAREFYLWVGFDQLSPIGDERSDFHSAQIASAVYQSQGAKVKMQDVLIDFGASRETSDSNVELETLFSHLMRKNERE